MWCSVSLLMAIVVYSADADPASIAQSAPFYDANTCWHWI